MTRRISKPVRLLMWLVCVTCLAGAGLILYGVIAPGYVPDAPVARTQSYARIIATAASAYYLEYGQLPRNKSDLYGSNQLRRGETGELDHFSLEQISSNKVQIRYIGPAIGKISAKQIAKNSCWTVEVAAKGTPITLRCSDPETSHPI